MKQKFARMLALLLTLLLLTGSACAAESGSESTFHLIPEMHELADDAWAAVAKLVTKKALGIQMMNTPNDEAFMLLIPPKKANKAWIRPQISIHFFWEPTAVTLTPESLVTEADESIVAAINLSSAMVGKNRTYPTNFKEIKKLWLDEGMGFPVDYGRKVCFTTHEDPAKAWYIMPFGVWMNKQEHAAPDRDVYLFLCTLQPMLDTVVMEGNDGEDVGELELAGSVFSTVITDQKTVKAILELGREVLENAPFFTSYSYMQLIEK